MAIVDKQNIKVGSLEESNAIIDERLKQWRREATSSSEIASVSLLQAVGPAWTKWLKESGTKNADILGAAINVSAGLLSEVICNIARDGAEDILADVVTKMLGTKIKVGIQAAKDGVAEEIPAFRRHDG